MVINSTPFSPNIPVSMPHQTLTTAPSGVGRALLSFGGLSVLPVAHESWLPENLLKAFLFFFF